MPRAPRKQKQKRIEGTFDPEVEVVQDAAEKYVVLLTTRMQTQEEENTARRELLEVMIEHDVLECEIEGYKVNRIHLEEDKVRVKKISEAVAAE